MITQETAAALWNCHREIVAGQKLLSDMEEVRAKSWDIQKTEPTLKDAFGNRRHLQMGIPCGENAHRLLDVAPDLAESVIRAHIANKQAELVKINERARIELDSRTEAA